MQYVLLVAAVSLLSASCSKGEDNDPDPASGNPTDVAMVTWLLGTWGNSDSNGSIYIDNTYEFKKDGTFYKILSSGFSGGRQATAYSGKFRVSGNKLTLYKQLKSTGPATATHFKIIWYITMDSFETKDVPCEDTEYIISKIDNDILRIGTNEGIYTDFKRGQ